MSHPLVRFGGTVSHSLSKNKAAHLAQPLTARERKSAPCSNSQARAHLLRYYRISGLQAYCVRLTSLAAAKGLDVPHATVPCVGIGTSSLLHMIS